MTLDEGTMQNGRWALAIFAALLFVAAPTLAQDEGAPPEGSGGSNFANPSKAQLDLYEAGAKAFQDGQYDRAVERFKASLQVGELNITYLNMGRALFKAGLCVEAREAYDKVAGAPQIREPSPVEVLSRLDGYRADLATCPGELRITCTPSDMMIVIDDGDFLSCPSKAISLPPGKHSISGRFGGQSSERTVTIKAMERLDIEMSVDDADTLPTTKGDGSPFDTLGWVGLGVSAASLVTGVGFFFATGSAFDEAEALGAAGNDRVAFNDAVARVEDNQTLSNVFYGISAVALIGSMVCFFALDGNGPERRADAEDTDLNLTISPLGLGLGGTF